MMREALEIDQAHLRLITGRLTTTAAKSAEIERLEALATQPNQDPRVVVDAASMWGRIAADSDKTEAARGFEVALAGLERLFNQTLIYRFDAEAVLRKASGLVAEAAFAQVLDEQPRAAVRTLDSLRAITSSAMRLLIDLKGKEPKPMGAFTAEALRDGALPAEISSEARGRQRNLLAERQSRIRLPGEVTFADVAQLATTSIPLCYANASPAGGFLAIVRPDRDPQILMCPELTTDAVNSVLTQYWSTYVRTMNPILAGQVDERSFARASETLSENLRGTASWLWTSAVRDLVSALDGCEACALVLGGKLAVLPFHVAADGEDCVLDHCAIRYLPSSPFLWPSDKWRPRTFFGCGNPDRYDETLAGSEAELEDAAQYFESPAPPLLYEDATTASVLAGLDDADVVHFSCHGTATPSLYEPASLQLADGPLTVGEVRARVMLHERRPMVVLSSCQTALYGGYALDEMVGLPLAWLETGARAVVAPQWDVDIDETRIVFRSFYSLWLEGRMEPWQALRHAIRERRDALRNGAATDGFALTPAAFTYWG